MGFLWLVDSCRKLSHIRHSGRCTVLQPARFSTTIFNLRLAGILRRLRWGSPIASLLTIWAGPVLVPRASPRKLLVGGTGLSAVALGGFSLMQGSLATYFALYLIYTIGYI
jgi:hypothetical protein